MRSHVCRALSLSSLFFFPRHYSRYNRRPVMAGYEENEESMEDVMGDALNKKQKNTLPLYGNKETMNINPMILSNIQGSAYFKEELYQLKTFHEVIDEIFYKVEHLEPWEKGSRKLAGQVGMCGGVRGVAAGGIVSSAYCLLYKLFTLRLTRRQVQAMLDHVDSAYIRGLGFMYVRYCQPPPDFWDWFVSYLDDPEEIDLKAGGGFKTTIGALCRMMLIKLDWFGTMLPRISVAISKTLEQKLKAASQPGRLMAGQEEEEEEEVAAEAEVKNGEVEERDRERGKKDVWGEAARRVRTSDQPSPPDRRDRRSPPPRDRRQRSRERRERSQSRDRERYRRRSRSRSRERRRGNRSGERPSKRSRSRERPSKRSRSRSRDRPARRSRSHSRERPSKKSRSRSRDRPARRSRSRSRERPSKRSRSRSRDRPARRSRSRSRERPSKRSRSRSRDRPARRSRSRSRDRPSKRSRSKDRPAKRSRSHSKDRPARRSRSRSRDRPSRKSSRDRVRKSQSKERRRSRSRSREKRRSRSSSQDRDRK